MELKICDWEWDSKVLCYFVKVDVIWKLINPNAKEKKVFEGTIEREAAMECMSRFQVKIVVAIKWCWKKQFQSAVNLLVTSS